MILPILDGLRRDSDAGQGRSAAPRILDASTFHDHVGIPTDVSTGVPTDAPAGGLDAAEAARAVTLMRPESR
ncbi:hypothetical protein GPA10_26295 [Streptomyces sp. p1417]|uniref:Uncharacterized protein n=1 Tax=Streptomyces typhae TaxID=2681492 RepID=A0A6L6X2X1_9ACTN|nr:hypothetical protein [Streptomyces typhae]MVO88173.1 hypothetical protein [Streptomyces typhae]